MAKYVCPSCGAEFNGKKCRNCNYEALEDGQKHRTCTPRTNPRASAPQWDARKENNRKQERRLSVRLVIFFVLLFGMPFLQFILTTMWNGTSAFSSFFTRTSEYAVSPEPDAAYIASEAPSAAKAYEIIYEDDDYTIWADCQNMWLEGIVSLKVENRTDRPAEFFADNVVLNDKLVSPNSYLYINVSKHDTEQGEFYLEELNQEQPPVYPVKASFNFYACDANNYDTLLETDTITLTAPDGEMVPIAPPEGILVGKEAGMRLFFVGWEDPDWVPGGLRFGMINDTDRWLAFYCNSATVNGQETSAFLYCSLPPHTVAYDNIFLFSLSEDLGLTSSDQLESMELRMGVYDEDAPEGIIEFQPFSVPMP